MPQSKPYLTFEQQCARIQEYGIDIGSPDEAVHALRRLGYYRLSGYWYPYRLQDTENPGGPPQDKVYPGVRLHDIVQMCDFDDRLRSVLLNAIAAVELSVRVSVAYRLGRHGGMAYLTAEAWSAHMLTLVAPSAGSPELAKTPLDVFLDKHRETVERAREDFVVHFNRYHGGEIPIWAAIELWDFGTLSCAFRMLKPEDRQTIAREFGITSRVLGSWLVALNDLRNFCAHHARLSRRVYVNKPRIPRAAELPEFAHIPAPQPGDREHLYSLMCVLAFLERQIRPGSAWRREVVEHFASLERLPWGNTAAYGLPGGWAGEELWAE